MLIAHNLNNNTRQLINLTHLDNFRNFEEINVFFDSLLKFLKENLIFLFLLGIYIGISLILVFEGGKFSVYTDKLKNINT